MESIIVGTFKDFQDAEKSLDRMRELDLIDDIAIYNSILVQKKNETELEFIYSDGPDTKHFPAKGAIAGSLVGALAGPLGIVVGAMVGGISASLEEYDAEKGEQEFLETVRRQLNKGSYALIMDVEEDDPSLINFYLQQNNATVTRTVLDDVYANREMEEWESLVREISSEEKALEKSREDEKAAIKEKIQKLKAKKEAQLNAWMEKKSTKRKRLHNKLKKLKPKFFN